jgi:hypothetical protein
MVGGIMTATGHGLVGSFLRSHHMTLTALRLGKMSMEGGAKQFKQGLDDLKRA